MEYVNLEHKNFIDKLDSIIRKGMDNHPYPPEGNIYWAHIDQYKTVPDECSGTAWNNFADKRRLIFRLANENHFSEVLEIGFNAGHSTSFWLFSNPNTKVKVIDIENQPYTRECAEFVKSYFPDRFEYYPGDSTVVFQEKNEHFLNCDLVHIDGGHSLEEFKIDLSNSLNLPYNNFVRKILVDDADITDIDQYIRILLKQKVVNEWKLPDYETNKRYQIILTKNS